LKTARILAAASAVALAAGLAFAPVAASASPAAPQGAHPQVTVTGPLKLAPAVELPRTHLPAVKSPKATTLYSSNWSGWADAAHSGKTITSVSVNYTIPSLNSAKCTPGTSGYAFVGDWAGIDGLTDNTVEQTGTASYCYAGGGTGLYAWYEMYPLNPVAYSGVRPGDAIHVSATYSATTRLYHLVLVDETIDGEISVYEGCPSGSVCHDSSAEVIAEAPGGGPTAYNLADFGQTGFTAATVDGSGLNGTLASSSAWTAYPVVMEYDHIMDEPTALEGGQAFDVNWLAPY
jgi:hypothetical protein